MAAFPTDVITDVLRVLPVKSLTRLRCVSKSWGSLIKDPHFAKLHLHHSFKTNNNVKLVLDGRTDDDDDDDDDDAYETFSVDFDSLGDLEQHPRPFPTTRSRFTSRIFGSCNGLLAVYHHETGIALWNPSTRTCHYLPKLTIGDVTERDYHILGFGYDKIGDDYKVVRMIASGKSVMIYSLKTDSWKRIKDCPYQIPVCEEQDGAYANGSLHWVGDERDTYFGGRLIFGLDLWAESFHQVPEPDIHFRNFGYKNVGVLGGSLCVFREYTNRYDEDHIILWVMKEYAVKESWSELIYLSGEEWRLTSIYYTRAIAYSRRGDQILLEDSGSSRQPAWFDLEKQTGEVLRIPGAPRRFSAMIYIQSLVSVLPMHH
ncbi:CONSTITUTIVE EXPRESSER OF PR GENES 1, CONSTITUTIVE EXPRESSER OF PR GENES 30 [Hibiscus trionum]|uniref:CONSTITUTIVE EXPRESSER OF PR GENES 1, CONSTITUTIVE EXPRESSER OF PR GENES 30 n=1 Tax=Hibiscus trionum TaxID=183268 RepID=A0A9W7LX25_HIBTR|nr:CONSTITUTIVE EXPRESSER OF PR GENES 1, CONSTITUTIVE EXPRESSER OF PR GENES 30 [Hibiscus trionum]